MLLDGITLPDSLIWENEHTWNQIAQTQDRSVMGRSVIQEQLKVQGREIELVGPNECASVTKATLDALRAKEGLLEHDMACTLPDGQTFTVRFNRSGGNAAIQAPRTWLWEGIPGQDTLYSLLRLRLITVES